MEEKEKTTTAPAGVVAPAKPAGNPLMKYGILVGIVLTMVAIGYVVTVTMIKPKTQTAENAEAVKATSAAEHPTEEAHAKEAEPAPDSHAESKDEKDGEHGNASDGAPVFEVEDIIVNPAGTGGTRYLSVSIGFEVKDEKTLAMLEARQPHIRDALITILGSKNIEQLTDMKQKEIARLQIKKRVSQLLATEDIVAVFFTGFVIQ